MLEEVWNDFINSSKSAQNESPVLFSLLKQSKLNKLTEKKITIECKNSGVNFFLSKNSQRVKKLLSSFFGKKIEVEFVTQKSKNKKHKKTSEKTIPLINYNPPINDLLLKSGLNPMFSFENFAVSSTNQIAYAAAKAVADNPGKTYNPLFLYGGVGVGKTHLAQAVSRHVLEKKPNARVFFSPGDQFTNELIESIKNKTTQKFRRKYRKLSVLIIDDVQFIAGKRAVQEEFFHTFNSIVSSGGQIILTSDKSPSEIKNLEDRLRSRFSGGLIIDIQPPDFELRTAIILIKARQKNIPVDIEVAKMIAEKTTDARSLEGVLLSIYARAISTNGYINQEITKSFFNQMRQKKIQQITPKDVIENVCLFYNVKKGQIKSPDRTERVAFARQVIMFLLRTHLNLKLEEIARILKRKDHTTIIYGVNKIKNRLLYNSNIKNEIDKISKSFLF